MFKLTQWSNSQKKFTIIGVAAVIALITILAFTSSGPSNDVILDAVLTTNPRIIQSIRDGDLSLTDWKVVNTYTRKIQDETIYVCEVVLTVEAHVESANSGDIPFTVRLVKRGNSWYYLHS